MTEQFRKYFSTKVSREKFQTYFGNQTHYIYNLFEVRKKKRSHISNNTTTKLEGKLLCRMLFETFCCTITKIF